MNQHSPSGPGRLFKWLYIASMAVLVFSGFGQMPIFKRYYLADIPGMAWAADFHITLQMHYVAAAVFLALSAYYIIYLVFSRHARPVLKTSGWVRGVILFLLVMTGFMLSARNMSSVDPPSGLMIFASLTHIAGTMLFLVAAATYFRLAGRKEAKQ